MSTVIDTTPPSMLLDAPKPHTRTRLFHRRTIQVWEGEVAVESIKGWIQNRRTEMLVDEWRDQYGSDPDREQLADIVTEDPVQRIKPLAANISRNGVRVPIILSKDGRLLDGNRRYFAVRHLLAGDKNAARSDIRRLPAWVLADATEPDDETDVITELNLIDDERLEWPYFVKAWQVYEDHFDRRMTVKDIADRYDLEASQVRQQIAAVQLAMEFMGYRAGEDEAGDHRPDPEARRLVYDKLIWFDQLARTHSRLLDSDAEFKQGVFEMLLEDPPKFSQSRDFRQLGDIRKSTSAWAALRGTTGPAGLEQAQRLVASEKLDAQRDPIGKLERAISLLEEIVAAPELHRADPALLSRFRRVADEIPQSAGDPQWRIGRMRQWLEEMTVEEVAGLPDGALSALAETHRTVLTMAESWATQKSN